MLRWFQIARLATEHSPEKEQRLLAFAATPTTPGNTENNSSEANPEPGSNVMDSFLSGVRLSQRQQFHDEIFKAVDMDSQRKVVDEYLLEITDKIGTVDRANLNPTKLNEVIELTRMSIVEELNSEETDRNTLAAALQGIDSSTVTDAELQRVLALHQPMVEKYFVLPKTMPSHQIINLLQALLSRDIERVRKQEHKAETGIKWEYLAADEFEKLYRKIRNIRSKEPVQLPNAFSYGTIMVFNIEHEDFAKDGIGEKLAERAVFHEATHLALTNPTEARYGLKKWMGMLKSHPEWSNLEAAVQEVFKQDSSYLSGGGRNERIANEALAIYVANKRAPIDPSMIESNPSLNAQREVCEVLERIFTNPNSEEFNTCRLHLEATVDRFTEVKKRNGSTNSPDSVSKLLMKTAKDHQTRGRLLSDLKSEGNVSAELATNADAGVNIAEKKLEKAAEGSETLTAGAINAKIETLFGRLETLRGRYPALKKLIEGTEGDPDQRALLLATAEQNLEFLSQSGTDLTLLKKKADALNRWGDSEESGGLTVEEKSDFAETSGFPTNPYKDLQMTVQEADALVQGQRDEVLKELKTPVSWYETVFEEMKQEIDTAEEVGHKEPEATAEEEMTVGQWVRKNVLSSQGDVVWLTPLNIANIVKKYKEAIYQNYTSNQQVKENRIAKKLNFYKPIEHTLKKNARSTDNTESSEFKEYIEKEGYTFNEVFGPDGKGKSSGLLFQNRHNFNRAKAVLEYAADKAWMYFMNPLDGHNVYGIDYEAIEGHQSFEDLVAKHEAGKTHEIQHGYDRIDKMPDVPEMMETLVHELRHKNVFAVQGIIKRLQEKAKFSHSNTWMLTTILMLIRDESTRDPTLKLCLDKGMIDNISNFTITQSAWSITWFKLNRNKIEDWKKGDKFGNNETTRAMEVIEKQLAEGGAKFPDTDKGNLAKYEAIGMILAGKTFYEGNKEARKRGLLDYGWNPGARVSIFGSDTDLTAYREAFRDVTGSTDTEPGNTDSDYFNPGNGGADIMLLDSSQTSKILSRKSTSEWTYESKARGFITQVFMRYDELEKVDPDALQNFKKEMQKKFDYCVDGVWDESRRKVVVTDTDLQGNNMVDQLASRGLISDAKIQILAKWKADIVNAQRKPMKLENSTSGGANTRPRSPGATESTPSEHAS